MNRVLDTFLGIWVTNAFFTHKFVFGNASTDTFLDGVDKLQLDIPRRGEQCLCNVSQHTIPSSSHHQADSPTPPHSLPVFRTRPRSLTQSFFHSETFTAALFFSWLHKQNYSVLLSMSYIPTQENLCRKSACDAVVPVRTPHVGLSTWRIAISLERPYLHLVCSIIMNESVSTWSFDLFIIHKRLYHNDTCWYHYDTIFCTANDSFMMI